MSAAFKETIKVLLKLAVLGVKETLNGLLVAVKIISFIMFNWNEMKL